MVEKNQSPSFFHLDDGQLNEYLDGNLDRNQQANLERHLEICPDCTARFRELRSVFTSLTALKDVSLERDLSMSVLSAIPAPNKISGSLKWGALAQTALALILMILVMPTIIQRWVQPFVSESENLIRILILERLAAIDFNWGKAVSGWWSAWENWFSGWQISSVLETAQVTIWPLFFAAILLFVIGNGLLLTKVARKSAS